MSVGPLRLDGVAADVLPSTQLEAGRREFLRGRLVLDHHIRLALAQGAGTGAAQRLEIVVALVAIVPDDGEDVVHDLDVLGFHVFGAPGDRALPVLSGHGHSLLIEQPGQFGFRAVHTRRPWNCSR